MREEKREKMEKVPPPEFREMPAFFLHFRRIERSYARSSLGPELARENEPRGANRENAREPPRPTCAIS